MTPSHRCPSGFTLIELLIALVVVTLLASALAVPLAAQLNSRRGDEVRRILDEARDAVLGFAAAQGRLPCPATAASFGQEAFAPGASAADGNCADFHAGFLPAAALGLSGLDHQGFRRDPWETEGNRIRYAVFGGEVNGVAHALTRTHGMQMATLQGLGDAHYLIVCSTGATASGSGCGPAANQLTRKAAFVLLSTGSSGGVAPAPGGDEARNLDGDAVFVARAHGPDFDDFVDWGGILMVVNRLVVAGQLP
jgi:prepilin-type N-terminal cleavage/methylation domain-containing protein